MSIQPSTPPDCQDKPLNPGYRHLKLAWWETVLLGAMGMVILLSSWDSVEGIKTPLKNSSPQHQLK